KSDKLRHHFLPQHHLRLFCKGRPFIHVASRDGARIVKYASIRGQCARHKFYGDKDVEKWLESMESRHAAVFRAVRDLAWDARKEPLSSSEIYQLQEAILLQRYRTPRAARIGAVPTDKVMLRGYAEYLKCQPKSAE